MILCSRSRKEALILSRKSQVTCPKKRKDGTELPNCCSSQEQHKLILQWYPTTLSQDLEKQPESKLLPFQSL
jgi:hypothetical protein